MTPKVSVLIPVYNNQDTIGKAIESVLQQDFHNFELIILNDGSTDNTLAIVNEFKDNRIQVFSNEQRTGIPQARNFLLDKAQTSLISWLDGDDFYAPGKIRLQFELMHSRPDVSFCACDANMISEKSTYLKSIPSSPELLKAILFFKSPFVFSGVIMRKTAERFNENYARGQDFDMLYKLLNHGQPHVIKKVLVNHLVSSKQSKTDIEKTSEILNHILNEKLNSIGIEATDVEINNLNTLCRNYCDLNKLELIKSFDLLDKIVIKLNNTQIRSFMNYLLIKVGLKFSPLMLLTIKKPNWREINDLIKRKV
jgi:glycosyltransferase involved in cell wall biosynthesis